jgi:putative intracellular protease/amidase
MRAEGEAIHVSSRTAFLDCHGAVRLAMTGLNLWAFQISSLRGEGEAIHASSRMVFLDCHGAVRLAMTGLNLGFSDFVIASRRRSNPCLAD